MKTVRLSLAVWRAVNRERASPRETFDGAVRRKLNMNEALEAPDSAIISISDETYQRILDLQGPDESLDYIIGKLFNVY